MANEKYIALIDCDSFFVSCERKLNPALKNLPVSVVSGERGCVISRSREAKMLGVPMGIPLFQAVEKFPECIYISANHYNYTKISNQIMKILKDFSPNVEVYSIDEAFVDFTGLTKLYKMNYYKLAQHVQKRILDEVGIPVSIGVSRTKTLAKLASDKSKTCSHHVCIVGKCGIKKLLEYTDIQEVWGIGRRLGVKVRGLGVRTALDFINKDEYWIKARFGKNGLTTMAELAGVRVLSLENNRELPKSISDTKSFAEFTSDLNFLKNELAIHIHDTCTRLRKINCKCKTVGLLIKTKDFRTIYEKVQLDVSTDFEFEISRVVYPLLEQIYSPQIQYRSIGIVLEDFNSCDEEQLLLFDERPNREKNEKLGKSLDILEKKFGRNIVRTGFVNKNIPFKQGFLTTPKDV